jgi:hypothetical protein
VSISCRTRNSVLWLLRLLRGTPSSPSVHTTPSYPPHLCRLPPHPPLSLSPPRWFGIEPNPADVLIQPILAYGDGTPDYTIFTGFFDWHDGNWVQSTTQTVTPGTQLLGTIDWDATAETYRQCIQVVSSGKPICTRVSKANTHGELFNQIFFVVEHQPNSCGEYPANGGVTFENINVQWEDGKVLAPADWTVAQFKPACNSQGKVLSATSLEFTWSTS